MDKIKIYATECAVATTVAGFTSKLGILGCLLIILLVCMIIDFLSGMAASTKESVNKPNNKLFGWNSDIGRKGIRKKFGYVVIVVSSILLDLLIYMAGGYLNFNMPTSTFFSIFVTILYILNELLSIVENGGRLGAPIPNFLKKTIAVLKDKAEKSGE